MATELNEVAVNEQTQSFDDIIVSINTKYIALLSTLIEKFKYHDELIGPLEHDLKLTNEKLLTNKYQVLDTITSNFLYCMEQISDHNSDYFIYQKEKVQKKNGKVHKNRLPKLGNRTVFKKILNELDNKSSNIIFSNLVDYFKAFTYKENDVLYFSDEYIQYVKDNFNDDKNFSKMIMVIDNINNILEESDYVENKSDEESENDNENTDNNNTKKNKKDKKKGKSKKDGSNIGLDFMNGLENTKIAQLAKNISEKINLEDYPILTDPTKLLSSLSNPTDNGNGIQDLLKFVVGEVEGAFKNNNMTEGDLIGEAQNIMGQFSNMSGFDPMSVLKEGNLDMSQFADIFSNLSK